MHDFVSYLFYLLQRGMRFAVPAALVCGLILAVCYAVCRRQGRRFAFSAMLVHAFCGGNVLCGGEGVNAVVAGRRYGVGFQLGQQLIQYLQGVGR